MKSAPGKAERLFRAAVSAFCSLTRPTRSDAAQLDDLALPLYDQVSADARRYVAAALSECRKAPAGLVRRLANEPLEIAAPLLVRSPALSDIELLSLIGRHGLQHATAIGRRAPLNPAIAELIAALVASAPASVAARAAEEAPVVEAVQRDGKAPRARPSPRQARLVGATSIAPVDSVRAQLRAMMAVGGTQAPAPPPPVRSSDVPLYDRLKATALSGTPALFQTALADAIGIGFREARALTETPRYARLMTVLRGLDLSAEQAFLLTAAVYPSAFPHAEAMRLFSESFALTHPDAGRDEIRRLRGESISAAANAEPVPAPAQNTAPLRRPLLKVS